MKRNLAIHTLDVAVALRQLPKSCIHYTDPSSQYRSHNYQKLLKKCVLEGSMSGKGNCYHNSMIETFSKSLEAELIWRKYRDIWPQFNKRFLNTLTSFIIYGSVTHR